MADKKAKKTKAKREEVTRENVKKKKQKPNDCGGVETEKLPEQPTKVGFEEDELANHLLANSPLNDLEKRECLNQMECKVYKTGKELVEGLQHIEPNWKTLFANRNTEPKGCPAALIVTASAIRAVEMIRELADFHRACRIAKLFSKHFKVQEQLDYLSSHAVCVGIGTPARLSKLVDCGALDTAKLQYLILDLTLDAKKKTLVDIKETSDELWFFLTKYCQSKVKEKNLKIVIVSKDTTSQ